MTSQSIEGYEFPDFEMLDAETASAWYQSKVKKGKNVSVERRMGEQTQKALASGEKVFLEEEAGKRAQVTPKEIARIRHVIIGILPYVKITNLNRDAKSATNVCSDTLRLLASPAKCRRKVVAKDLLPYWRIRSYWVAYSRILSHRRSLFSGRAENWDQIVPSHSPRAGGTTQIELCSEVIL